MSVSGIARLGSVRARQRGGGKFIPGTVAYDFYISATGGTGAGTIGDPWSIAYGMGSGAGTAQGDGKLPTSGARIAIRGKSDGTVQDYHVTGLELKAHGVVGSGVDNDDGKLIYEGYRSSVYAKPERARIFGDLVGGQIVDFFAVDGNYVQLRFLEFAHDWVNRTTGQNAGSGVWIRDATDGVKVIHCIFRDCSNGVFSANLATGDCTGRHEVYGCDFRNNGWDLNDPNPPTSSSAHGCYIHHHLLSGARFTIEENIFGPTFANSCQLFHSGGYTEAIDYIGNVHYLAAALSTTSPTNWQTDGTMVVVGSEQGGRDIVLQDVFLFWTNDHGDCALVAPYGGTNNKITILRAYAVGGGTGFGLLDGRGTFGTQSDFTLQDSLFRPGTTSNRRCVRVTQSGAALGYVWSGNTWVRLTNATAWRHVSTDQNWTNFKTGTGLGSLDSQQDTDPTVNKVFVRPTARYQLGMGNVIIYNWENLTTVNVDLSTVLGVGNPYEIYDARDRVTPILSGTYAGGTVGFPMNTQVTDPTPTTGFLSGATPPNTVPLFNAFVVRRTG